MDKKLLIIALIMAGLAYYYYQNQANTGAKETINQLQSQLNHYKDLAQHQIANYLPTHSATNFTELTEKITGQAQKITDLETALLNLAKQKIKGKKDTERLINQLEQNWEKDKTSWQVEQKKLIANCATNYNLAQSQLTQLKTAQSDQQHFQQQLTKQEQTITELNQTLLTNGEAIQQLTRDKQELTAELQTKKNWAQANLPQLKQELFAQGQATYQELAETIDKAYFVKGKDSVKQKLTELAEFFSDDGERERETKTINKSPLSYSAIVKKKPHD